MPFVCGYLVKFVKDPELKKTKNGKDICQFTVSNSEGYGDNRKNSFLRCVAFGKTASLIVNHYKKGSFGLLGMKYSDVPFKKNEQGYDIPNPTFTVDNIYFLPKVKEVSNDDEDFVPYASSVAQMSSVGSEDDNGSFSALEGDLSDLPF